MTRSHVTRIVLFVSVFAVTAESARADVLDLLARVPTGANAVAFIDVNGVVTSPLGLRNNWKEKIADAYAAKPLIVPPTAQKVVLASWIEPATMLPIWEASVMEISAAPSMEQIARAERGFVDTLAGKQAAWSPINAYFLRLDARLLGALCPADRQFATRWAAQNPSTGKPASAYLRSAVGSIDPKTDFLFALDLQDAVAAKRVRQRLAGGEFESIVDKPIDLAKVSETLASVKGLMVQIDVDEDATGRGSVDFGRSTESLKDIAKPLLLEMVARSRAAISDFENWKVATKGNSITFEGKVSGEGLRRLFSVVDPPSPRGAGDTTAAPAAPAEAGQGDASGAATVAASKAYYQAISGMIDHLGTLLRRAPSMQQSGTYIFRDARRIDRLPILNVDPDLLQWGQSVSGQMMNLASVCTTGGLDARSQTLRIQDAGFGSADDFVGQESIDPNQGVARINVTRDRRAALANAREQVVQQVTPILTQVESSREQVRIAMTEKYKVAF